MKIVKVTHDSPMHPEQCIVVDDDHPYEQAELLFLKHFNHCIIKRMEIISNDVINGWAQ